MVVTSYVAKKWTERQKAGPAGGDAEGHAAATLLPAVSAGQLLLSRILARHRQARANLPVNSRSLSVEHPPGHTRRAARKSAKGIVVLGACAQAASSTAATERRHPRPSGSEVGTSGALAAGLAIET